MAHRDTPGGPVFLCLWANMWSESVQPYPTSRNCHENGRTESDNADFHGHKSALILRAACALVQTKKKVKPLRKAHSNAFVVRHQLILIPFCNLNAAVGDKAFETVMWSMYSASFPNG